MMDILTLGIKDLIKNIKLFILLLLLTMVSSLIMISSMSNLVYSFLSIEDIRAIQYEPIPLLTVDNNYEYSKKFEEVSQVLNLAGTTIFPSEEISRKLGTEVIVFVGNFEKDSEDRFYWYIIDYNYSKIDNKNEILEEIPATRQNPDLIEDPFLEIFFAEGDYILAKPVDVKYQNLSSYKLNNGEFQRVIEELSFSDEEITKNYDTKLESVFEQEESNNLLYLKKIENSGNSNFITRYMFPIYIMLMVFSLLAFFTFFERLSEIIFEEYRLHLIFGARKRDIFIRNIIFVCAGLLINFIVMTYLIGGFFNILFFLLIGVTIIYFFVQALAIVWSLKKLKIKG